MSKAERIIEILRGIDPNLPLQTEHKDDGSIFIIGPYPSMIFLLDLGDRPDGFIVSVNADAPNAVLFLGAVLKEFPDMEHYGPYGEIPETGEIVFHEEAYQIKEQNIVMMAMEIATRKNQEVAANQSSILVPDEKQLILPGM